jgi:hypothetical protein
MATDANAIVAPIRPKAMPVILTTPADVDQWLEADTVDALALQPPAGALKIVLRGDRTHQDSDALRLPVSCGAGAATVAARIPRVSVLIKRVLGSNFDWPSGERLPGRSAFA